jgi:hypothetical protein
MLRLSSILTADTTTSFQNSAHKLLGVFQRQHAVGEFDCASIGFAIAKRIGTYMATTYLLKAGSVKARFFVSRGRNRQRIGERDHDNDTRLHLDCPRL